MTRKEKSLLLKNLCEKLPYGVKVLDNSHKNYGVSKLINIGVDGSILIDNEINDIQYYPIIDEIKPYLRPMSSMTEEEVAEYKAFHCVAYEHTYFYPQFCTVKNELNMFDWFNAHHFDYRGLIEKGLALEAPEGIYNIKEHNKI